MFRLQSSFQPTGDQPQAIRELVEGLQRGDRHQVLLGVTGSGKTFTVANVVQQVQRPTLVMAHNKTLAAQLYQEFKEFFPDNAVEYFVSYYDYYQPEAYIPSTDTFIEKDAIINRMIERMRLSTTRSLFERRDVLIVASVSCIYGLGDEDAYYRMVQVLERGQQLNRDTLLRRLLEIHYERNDVDFDSGRFRVRGDTVEIFPAYEEDLAIRVEFFGDEIEAISEFDPFRGVTKRAIDQIAIFPASHYVALPESRERAIVGIEQELRERLAELRGEGRVLEAHRLEERTNLDLANLRLLGWCHGIENYSRHFTGRAPDSPPPCLMDYFPDDWLLVVDESHVTIPQVGAMFRGDRARKSNLVEHGFRLPSALDNRPLRFEEFDALIPQAIHVSATPADWELDRSGGVVTEQLIRPTGLLDPFIEVRPATTQVDDLIGEIRRHVDGLGDRVLVTTLTKRMAEDLTDYLQQMHINVRYLHSDVDTIERVELLRGLRAGDFDVLVGINLLREGLDLPEVSLVAILDADKEGFLRSERSLIQTAGRAARNERGRVIMYADRVTGSMQTCIDETLRRRRIQEAWNTEHGVTPRTISKAVRQRIDAEYSGDDVTASASPGRRRDAADPNVSPLLHDVRTFLADPGLDEARLNHPDTVTRLRDAMKAAARELEFERAAAIRDAIIACEGAGSTTSSPARASGGGSTRRPAGTNAGGSRKGPRR